MLAKNPGFTAVAIITLALGIGANTAIFSVVYDVLLKPLPYPQADRLIWVARTQPPFPPDWSLPFSGPNFLDLEGENRTFQYMTATLWGDFSLTGRGEPEDVIGQKVTADFFNVLGIQPILGRGFLPGEDQKGCNHEVVLSYGFWQRKYGGAQDVIGKTVNLSERTHTIVGVMPRGFGYPSRAIQLWVPLVVPETGRGDNSYRAIGRLKAGIALAQARADMSAIARRLAAAYPDTNDKEGVMLIPLRQWQGKFLRPTLLVLLAAVGLLLLIACANVANLMLARGAVRQREMAVRASLGAGRRRLIAQLLVESVLLALIGGAAALLVGHWSIALLRALKPNNLPELKEIGISLPVLWFTLLVSVLTGVIFGLAPAFQASGIRLNDALKSSGSGAGTSAERGRARNILIVVQVALSLVLLAGAGLMIRSFARFVGADPGFNPDHLLRFGVVLPATKYSEDAQVKEFYRAALDRIRALHGVESAAISYPAPPSGGESDGGFYVEGRRPEERNGEGEADAIWHIITPGYFHTMQTQLLRGRSFTPDDTEKGLPVVVINQALARHFFPHQDPIGKRLKVDHDNGKDWWQIVGVAADEAYAGWDSLYDNEIYFPFTRLPWPGMSFVVRTKIAPAAVAPEVRKAVWAVDKDLPIVGMETMEQALDQADTPRRFSMALLLAFAILAISVAGIGIYGVISYQVAQRTHEIGIRVALGAQKSDVLKMLVGQGIKLTLIGVAIGIVGAFGLTRFLSSLLYGVQPTDPLTFVAVSLILTAVALLASYIPARRATKVDPMVALRYE